MGPSTRPWTTCLTKSMQKLKRAQTFTNLVLAVEIAQAIEVLRMTLAVFLVLRVHLREISFVGL